MVVVGWWSVGLRLCGRMVVSRVGGVEIGLLYGQQEAVRVP